MDRHTKHIKLGLQENIGHCAMNIKMSFLWKRLMFGMQQSFVLSFPQMPLMKVDFKSWKIGLVWALLCEIMGRIYNTYTIFNPPTHLFFHPTFLTSSHLCS
jgi:hypothetical protein